MKCDEPYEGNEYMGCEVAALVITCALAPHDSSTTRRDSAR